MIEMKCAANGDITVNCVKALNIVDWDNWPDAKKLELIEKICYVIGATFENLKFQLTKQTGMIN